VAVIMIVTFFLARKGPGGAGSARRGLAKFAGILHRRRQRVKVKPVLLPMPYGSLIPRTSWLMIKTTVFLYTPKPYG